MRFVSKHKECSTSTLCASVGGQHFPQRHSLASHEATHIHTCNPAAVENTVASTVVRKLQPHCKHVIHYTVWFFFLKQDNNRKSFSSCQGGRKNTPLLEGIDGSQSSCAGAQPAMPASIHASAEHCYSVSTWNNVPRSSTMHTVKMTILQAGGSHPTPKTSVHQCHRVSQQHEASTHIHVCSELHLL